MAIIAAIPVISPLDPFTSAIPLIFVLSIAMIREGIEDRQRHKSDKELNGYRTTALVHKLLEETDEGSEYIV